MLRMLAIGIVAVGTTFTIHALGSTYWIEYLIRRHADHDGRWRRDTIVWSLLSTGVMLMALHLLEALAWAAALFMLPEGAKLKTFEEAFYFSMVTFTTLGYGDITLDPQWRLLSGVEAVNGILLVGWSTALLFTVVQRSWRLSHTSRPGSGSCRPGRKGSKISLFPCSGVSRAGEKNGEEPDHAAEEDRGPVPRRGVLPGLRTRSLFGPDARASTRLHGRAGETLNGCRRHHRGSSPHAWSRRRD